MRLVKVNCEYCGNPTQKQVRYYNYSIKLGMKMYCDSKCAGEAKKVGNRSEKKREAGRLYYKKWYERNREKVLKMRKEERLLNTVLGETPRVATITVLPGGV